MWMLTIPPYSSFKASIISMPFLPYNFDHQRCIRIFSGRMVPGGMFRKRALHFSKRSASVTIIVTENIAVRIECFCKGGYYWLVEDGHLHNNILVWEGIKGSNTHWEHNVTCPVYTYQLKLPSSSATGKSHMSFLGVNILFMDANAIKKIWILLRYPFNDMRYGHCFKSWGYSKSYQCYNHENISNNNCF